MSPRDGHLAELRCHCDDTADGHPLDAEGCTSEVEVKARPLPTWGSKGVFCPEDHYSGVHGCHGPAFGTCPVCGKRVKVLRIETRGDRSADLARRADEDDYAFLVRRNELRDQMKKSPRGPLLQIHPGMAPHRHAGQDCPGAGQVPAETHYTPGRLLAEWTAKNGDQSVA